jgi:hypothetical protein
MDDDSIKKIIPPPPLPQRINRSTMSRLPTSDQRTLPKPSSNGSRIQLQRRNIPSPKKSANPKPSNSTLEKAAKTTGVSGLKPPSGISKIFESLNVVYFIVYAQVVL